MYITYGSMFAQAVSDAIADILLPKREQAFATRRTGGRRALRS
jgi:hypothetical protein